MHIVRRLDGTVAATITREYNLARWEEARREGKAWVADHCLGCELCDPELAEAQRQAEVIENWITPCPPDHDLDAWRNGFGIPSESKLREIEEAERKAQQYLVVPNYPTPDHGLSEPCPYCRGTGGGVYNDCTYCGGNGVV